ncbi:sigma-70 family RNA polymerase sigma factor [Virgisporangium ochraceum]|uniref:RNA polymerase sigma factor n=2 Tax=Virgisporangium ochraceum TaxID=65505 RepID=A0A8J3ZU96_9ACTN|nr:RNA polymerase sigma factor [Virgisporangium ochraceum]
MTILEGMATETDEFARRTDPYRRELLAFAYRMLGSLHDAEDAVQETYLRAWQGYGGFAGRSSERTWLYRIATNVCLRAAERQGRRPLPAGLDTVVGDRVRWLEPVPDALVVPADSDPETAVAVRTSIRLAFVAALQHLPARQRAVLILRDVLAWSAAEVADLLGTTVASVTSALQRARARARPPIDDILEPSEPAVRARVDRYATAFENADLDTLIALMRQDVVWEMPPLPEWYTGRDAVRRFVGGTVFPGPQTWRATHTAANGQPALALYRRTPGGAWEPHGIQVLAPTPDGFASVVTFLGPTHFEAFGLD